MKIKRLLALLLVFFLLSVLVPQMFSAIVPSVEAADAITTRINALRTKFPHMMFWNHYISSPSDAVYDESFSDTVTNMPCQTHDAPFSGGEVGEYMCNYFDYGIQCWGFACKLFFEVFGVRASDMPERTDIANVKPGDWLRMGGHSALCIARSGSTLTIVEANFHPNGSIYEDCMIYWDRKVDLSSVTYFKRASNYDAVASSSEGLFITEQPQSAVVEFGASTTIKVAASGTGLTYQWQYKYANSSTWKNWSGRTSATLSLTGNSTNHLCQYRCRVSNNAGTVYSNAATLTVTPKITTQPKNATVAMGATTTFTVAASGTGLNYQWQYQYANTTAWKTWSGKTAATLTVTGKESNNGCSYRCIVKNSGGSVTSSAAKLTVTGVKPAITANPSNLSLALTKSGTFKVTAVGSGLSYQWQYSHDNGASWKNWSGMTSASLSVTGKADNNGCLYRCVVKNSYGSVNSASARLTVTDAKPRILVQPKNASVAIGKTVTMKVVAGGSGMSYQWQYKYPNGSWTNWSGMTSASLTITGKATNSGCSYRCVVKNSKGSVTSSAAMLTVTDAKPAITTNPSNLSLALTKTGTFQVKAVGSGLSYQWQYSHDNGASWKNWSGKTSASLTVTGKADNNGCLYRCVVKNSKGSVNSASARLTVTDAKPRILVQPKNVSVAIGKTVTMKVVAGGSGLSYQWQYKYPNGSWKDWSGKTSASLTITGKTTNGGCQYRCVVKNSHGSVTSSAATLTVK